jgi:hypothetical protein
MEGKIATVAGSLTLHFPDRPCLRRLATLALITHVLLPGFRSIVVVDIPSEPGYYLPRQGTNPKKRDLSNGERRGSRFILATTETATPLFLASVTARA